MNTQVEARAQGEIGALLGPLIQLTKPGIVRLVVVTTISGAVIAPGPVAVSRLLFAVLGTALVVGSANALNMVLEHDVDAKMERTRGRPIPSGRLSREVSAWFGLGLGAVGLPVLFVLVNPISGMLAAAALVSYVLVYTPLKRISPIALPVGAVPGAIPPLIGWTSMTADIDLAALSLFAILLVWQLPHFHAIALFRRKDYEAAGLRVSSVVHGEASSRRSIVATSVLLAVASTAPYFTGLGGVGYLVVAIGSGLAFTGLGLRGLAAGADDAWPRRIFFASMPHLVLLYVALMVVAR